MNQVPGGAASNNGSLLEEIQYRGMFGPGRNLRGRLQYRWQALRYLANINRRRIASLSTGSLFFEKQFFEKHFGRNREFDFYRCTADYK
ncbi:MAG: hypothetical protein HQ498_05465 [Pseudohongiella sp.]|nr:hypothetical protein [Pseudohongiella sp.]